MNFQFYISFRFSQISVRATSLVLLIFFSASRIIAQTPGRDQTARQAEADFTWWYVGFALLALCLAGAAVWRLKTGQAKKVAGVAAQREKMIPKMASRQTNSPGDTERMPPMRGEEKTADSLPEKSKNLVDILPKTNNIFHRLPEPDAATANDSGTETKENQPDPQIPQSPVFQILKIEPAGSFVPLSVSNDEGLTSAIEQAFDEFEEDEEIRALAVRILARFKTQNSIEALRRIALYELSSDLRSKAVTALADFDHETVFETILLGCADPTREVRAAAARGLFRLTFDRADAWSRIAETGDAYRMRQAARAASEANLVKRSFDRLIHQDRKIVYEAVALLALMIRAGETEDIFQALLSHQNTEVKLALVHVLGLAEEQQTLPKLYEMLESAGISQELKDKISEIVLNFKVIPA